MTFAREDLPTDVVVSYNGFTFPSNLAITGFHTVPVLDRAGRTFIGLRHDVTIQFHISSLLGETADESVPAIRAQLMQPAGALVLANTAFGNITINPAAGVVVAGQATWDLAWGPRPTKFEQKPYYKLGSTITWTCEFLLNACTGGVPTSDILEWNYGLTFAIDRSGYTTRTLKGTVSIPMTRKAQADRTLSGNVDQMREKITPLLAIGFRRESQSFELSEDKRTLSFTFVDVQMPPNVPPDNCVVSEASHSVDVDCKNPNRVVQTLRASYELPSSRARGEALTHFLNLLQARVAVAQQKKLSLIPLHFHAGEPEIYGRKTADFAFSYYILYSRTQAGKQARLFPPASFLQDSGIWQPVPTSKWATWAASMAVGGISLPRGTAGLVWNPAEDVIVDLCQQARAKSVELTARAPRLPSVLLALFKPTPQPTPDDSWLHYTMRLEVKPIDNTVALTTLPTKAVAYSPVLSSLSDVQGYALPYPQQGGQQSSQIVQMRAAPRIVVTLAGAATRLGYDITPPQLVTVGGKTPMPFNDENCGFRTWIAASAGIPIVCAQWVFRYILTDPAPGDFGPPNNPVLGGTSGGGSAVLKGSNYT